MGQPLSQTSTSNDKNYTYVLYTMKCDPFPNLGVHKTLKDIKNHTNQSQNKISSETNRSTGSNTSNYRISHTSALNL